MAQRMDNIEEYERGQVVDIWFEDEYYPARRGLVAGVHPDSGEVDVNVGKYLHLPSQDYFNIDLVILHVHSESTTAEGWTVNENTEDIGEVTEVQLYEDT